MMRALTMVWKSKNIFSKKKNDFLKNTIVIRSKRLYSYFKQFLAENLINNEIDPRSEL